MLTKNIEGVKYFITLDEKTRAHIVNGNSKLGKGIYTFNLLPGDTPLTLADGTQLTNISGSCGGCCSSCKNACYAMIGAKKNQTTVIPSTGDNTLLARYALDELFHQINAFVLYNIVSVIRLHSSGEFLSYAYFLKWVEFAKNHPEIKIYTYTKRYNYLDMFFSDGGELPENFIINVSIWHNSGVNKWNLPEFIYDDGAEDIGGVVHCPAVDKNGNKTGITCANCRRCFTAKNGTKTAVYAH